MELEEQRCDEHASRLVRMPAKREPEEEGERNDKLEDDDQEHISPLGFGTDLISSCLSRIRRPLQPEHPCEQQSTDQKAAEDRLVPPREPHRQIDIEVWLPFARVSGSYRGEGAVAMIRREDCELDGDEPDQTEGDVKGTAPCGTGSATIALANTAQAAVWSTFMA